MVIKMHPIRTTSEPPSRLPEFEEVYEKTSETKDRSGKIDNELVEKLEDESKELVAQLREAHGSHELKLIDRIVSIGLKLQRTAGVDLDLLRTRVRDFLNQGKTTEKISNELIELRMALNAINPNELTRKNFASKLLSWFPFIRVFDPGIKALKKIAIQYESVSTQVSIIEKKLREGLFMLTKENR